MNTFKRNLSIALVLVLLFTGLNYTGFGSWLDGVLQEGPAISYATTSAFPATSSTFIRATASDAVMKTYYTRTSTCSAYYKDRNGADQYRVYGVGEEGLGWYAADNDDPETEPAGKAAADEYMTSAPKQYTVKAQAEYTAEFWQAFYTAHPEFANTEKTALKSEYEVSWDGSYNLAYIAADTGNVYKTAGAWKLIHKGESNAIYYLAYGSIPNGETKEQTDQWFLFNEGAGIRYKAVFTGVPAEAKPYGGTLYGAVASIGNTISAPDVTGYTTPDNQEVSSDNAEITFTYTAHTSKLVNYSYDAGADQETTLTYDGTATAVSTGSAHAGYELECYVYQAD